MLLAATVIIAFFCALGWVFAWWMHITHRRRQMSNHYRPELTAKEVTYIVRMIRGPSPFPETVTITHALRRSTLYVKASPENDYVQDVIEGTRS